MIFYNPKRFLIPMLAALAGCAVSGVSRSANDLESKIDDVHLVGAREVEVAGKLPHGFIEVDKNSPFFKAGSMVFIRKTRGVNDDIYEYVRADIVDHQVAKVATTLWTIKMQ